MLDLHLDGRDAGEQSGREETVEETRAEGAVLAGGEQAEADGGVLEGVEAGASVPRLGEGGRVSIGAGLIAGPSSQIAARVRRGGTCAAVTCVERG